MGYEEMFPPVDSKWHGNAAKRFASPFVDNPHDRIDVDPEMIEALQNLRREEPSNPLWAEMLGYVRFRRGGWEIVDALSQMTDALSRGAQNFSLPSSRQAVRCPRRSRRNHPRRRTA